MVFSPWLVPFGQKKIQMSWKEVDKLHCVPVGMGNLVEGKTGTKLRCHFKKNKIK